VIPCEHWKPFGAFGECSISRYGGRPSLGVCRHVCDLGPKEPRPQSQIRSLPVIQPWVIERRAICGECDESTGSDLTADCRIVAAKHPGRANIATGTRKPETACPLGKFAARGITPTL
jgi:hypothetical protein